jgi:hypothetical protein
MKNIVVSAVIGIIIGLLAASTLLERRSTQTRVDTAISSENISEAVISRSNTIIKSHGNDNIVIKAPKTQEILIETTKTGELNIKSPGYLPVLSVLPQFGVAFSRTIDPQIGLQFLRSEAAGVGVSVGVSPKMISLHIDKDIQDNSYFGIGLGYRDDLNTGILVRWGLFF